MVAYDEEPELIDAFLHEGGPSNELRECIQVDQVHDGAKYEDLDLNGRIVEQEEGKEDKERPSSQVYDRV